MGFSGLEPIFLGVHDIAAMKVSSLTKPEYRKKYEDAYNADLRRYGGELTLEKVNKKLLNLRKAREEFIKRWRQSGTRRPLSKRMVIGMNHFLLPPAHLKEEETIDNALELGGIAEFLYAEKLPSFRLPLYYKEYIIMVVPDGVADDYAYEFKATTQSDEEVEKTRDQAVRQAYLYAYTFKRPNIKAQVAQFHLLEREFPIQIRDLPKPDILTIFTAAPEDEALRILSDFDTTFRSGTEQK